MLRHLLRDVVLPKCVSDAIAGQRLMRSVSPELRRARWLPISGGALARSRFGLFPPFLRSSLRFVVDIGANEGQWLECLLQFVDIPEVWAFEPNPDALRKCRARLARYHGIVYHPMALGDRAATTTLHVTASSDFASLLAPRTSFLTGNYGEDAATVISDEKVDVLPLDSIVPADRSIDLIKLDVQGFERSVIAGAGRTLEATRAILIEGNFQSHYDGDDTFESLSALLRRHGFEFWSISPPYNSPHGRSLWADAMFIKEP